MLRRRQLNPDATYEAVRQRISCRKPGSVNANTNLNRGLEAVPAEIGLLTALERLDLSGNYLNDLPTEVSLLQKLEYLDLARNEFSILPIVVFSLASKSLGFQFRQ